MPIFCAASARSSSIDGGTHGTEIELARDVARSVGLRQLGYRLFRVRNIDVYEDIDRVLDALLGFIEAEHR